MWKEIRGYKHYMLIGSELDGHGVQIFDMSKVRCLLPPYTYFLLTCVCL